MTDQTEQYDLDSEWLYSILERANKRPTDDEEDAFCMLVWDLYKQGMTIKDARTKALGVLYK
jgi:hypothetical protein